MTDYYKTDREALVDYQKEALKYRELKRYIKRDIKKYRTLVEATKNENYKLAYSMLADYLEELKEE